MCDVALEQGLDLQQLYGGQDADSFISRGIKLGVARRFISDIAYWVQQLMASDGGIVIEYLREIGIVKVRPSVPGLITLRAWPIRA